MCTCLTGCILQSTWFVRSIVDSERSSHWTRRGRPGRYRRTGTSLDVMCMTHGQSFTSAVQWERSTVTLSNRWGRVGKSHQTNTIVIIRGIKTPGRADGYCTHVPPDHSLDNTTKLRASTEYIWSPYSQQKKLRLTNFCTRIQNKIASPSGNPA